MFYVKVGAHSRWSNVTVAGWHFTRVQEISLSDDVMTDEIRNHEMLDVRHVPDIGLVDATERAAELMIEHNLTANEVVGTGVGGRIIVADVERTLADMEAGDDTNG